MRSRESKESDPMLPFHSHLSGALPTTSTKISSPVCSTAGSSGGPTFPSRLHCDLWADVAPARCCHGCSPDVVLFTTGKVRDTVEEHLRVGFVLTGRLGQRARNVMLANCDNTVTQQAQRQLLYSTRQNATACAPPACTEHSDDPSLSRRTL